MVFRREPSHAGRARVHGGVSDVGYRENAGIVGDIDHGHPPSVHPSLPAYSMSEEAPGSGAASAVTFLAGVWLVISPFVLDLVATGRDFGVYWNHVTIGIAIGLLALVRASAPRSVPWFSVVNVVLGAWLIVAPWVLGYDTGTNAPAAVVNDVVTGAVVVIAAAFSAALTYRHRARIHEEARNAGRRSAAEAG